MSVLSQDFDDIRRTAGVKDQGGIRQNDFVLAMLAVGQTLILLTLLFCFLTIVTHGPCWGLLTPPSSPLLKHLLKGEGGAAE